MLELNNIFFLEIVEKFDFKHIFHSFRGNCVSMEANSFAYGKISSNIWNFHSLCGEYFPQNLMQSSFSTKKISEIFNNAPKSGNIFCGK